MNTLLVVVAVLVVIVALAAVALLAQRSRRADERPGRADVYELVESLFTPAERSFFGVLETLDHEGLTLTTKVRLADVFSIRKGLDRGEWQRALNRVVAKHVDFLLIRKSDGRPVLGIELDDASHQRAERKQRDRFVDEVFAAARLPLVHLPAQRTYTVQEITAELNRALAEAAGPATTSRRHVGA